MSTPDGMMMVLELRCINSKGVSTVIDSLAQGDMDLTDALFFEETVLPHSNEIKKTMLEYTKRKHGITFPK
jgi:hypothetical protein